jgi:hypothetical protein
MPSILADNAIEYQFDGQDEIACNLEKANREIEPFSKEGQCSFWSIAALPGRRIYASLKVA